jgi:hypothetical protein
MNIFGLRVFEADTVGIHGTSADELFGVLPPDLPDVAEYLEPGDLVRYHTQTRRSIETEPGCYVVRFYNTEHTGRILSIDEDTVTIRYYDRWCLCWRRAETTVEHLELILKHNVAI